jgi:hypothetical protein
MRKRRRTALRFCLLLCGLVAALQPMRASTGLGAGAPDGDAAAAAAPKDASPAPSDGRQALDDAWWTGPMLANSAATLPPGHFLIEPYWYDVRTAHADGLGSRAFVLYGLMDRLTVGFIPIVGFNKSSSGPSSSGVGFGDLTPLAQYRLTEFHAGSWLPTTSIEVQETLPTARYDRLGNRPGDGFGGGAYTTTLALNSQTYFWLPNRRILRLRFNVSQTLSNDVKVEDVSVYGTGAGFRGLAQPGGSSFADLSWEYSMTRRWVLALDVTYQHNGNTGVTGYNTLDLNSAQDPASVRLDSGSSDGFGFAPAIEYSWTPNLGVLLGARLVPAGHNTAASITPAVAINFFH